MSPRKSLGKPLGKPVSKLRKALFVSLAVAALAACDGDDGAPGAAGPAGPSGPAGTPGTDTNAADLALTLIGRYQAIDESGNPQFAVSAAEIVAYDAATSQLFVVNAQNATVDVLSLADPASPELVATIDSSALGGVANSVAVHNGTIAVAIEANVKTDNGLVAFYNSADLALLGTVPVGALPDMLTFTHDGSKVLVANEGEPNSYGQPDSVDPEGSISIIDISGGIASATVATADFQAFNAQREALIAAGVRIFGPGATVAQDLEPEYITISADDTTAWASLQEANALAVIDIASATITDILPLGLKNHRILGNELDASDRDDGINIRNWPVFGAYMPDAIAAYDFNGATYIVTANEGDARDYDGFSEEARVNSLTLDPAVFPDASLQNNANLGRLTVTTVGADSNEDGLVDRLIAFGARSFSIWSGNGSLMYDSGSDFEVITALRYGDAFNSNHEENGGDNRSDNKGPEPEGLALATIDGSTYAFIGLERMGGIMVYDITNPQSPRFQHYTNNRDLGQEPGNGDAGDLGPEGLFYIPASDSPNGEHLLVVGNEVSGTTAIYRIDRIQRQ